MKKIILRFFIVFVLIITICIILFYSYKTHTLNKLNQQNVKIDSIWNSIYAESENRLKLLDKLSITDCASNKISDEITNNISKRNLTEIDSLWELEYKTNKEFFLIEDCLNKHISNKIMLGSLKFNAYKLNKIVEAYNTKVLDFNKYYTFFPNSIIAKKVGLKRKKFFYMKYGENNDDYYNQKLKTKKWVETGKWD